MKYFVMTERNPQNVDFKRTRLERINQIESTSYDDSTYIYVNNMSYKKLDNSLYSKTLAFNFMELLIEKAKNEEIIDIDFIFSLAEKRTTKELTR